MIIVEVIMVGAVLLVVYAIFAYFLYDHAYQRGFIDGLKEYRDYLVNEVLSGIEEETENENM